MKPYILLLLLVPMFFTTKVKAQCCGAGNPLNGFGDVSGIQRKMFQISPYYKYSYSDQYYEGSKKADVSPDKMFYNFVSMDMAYGLSNRMSVHGQIGYFINKTKLYNVEGWNDMTGYGLGDAEFNLRYSVIKNVIKKIEVTPSIGIKLPVGVFDQEVDDVKLPISLQPSSGSLKYNASVFMSKRFEKYSLSAKVFAEYANRIQSENFDYKYGNLYVLSIYGSYNISRKLNTMIQLQYESRDKAKRENSQIVESSGGQVVYLIPQVNYTLMQDLAVLVNGYIPVYRYMNGIQIANKFSVSLRITKSFNFNKYTNKLIDHDKFE